jgi:hypothetical protein
MSGAELEYADPETVPEDEELESAEPEFDPEQDQS